MFELLCCENVFFFKKKTTEKNRRDLNLKSIKNYWSQICRTYRIPTYRPKTLPASSQEVTIYICVLCQFHSSLLWSMRVNRSKFVRKYLRFFRVNFQVAPRYNVILDGNFIYAALKYKIDIRERLQKLLQDEEPRLFILKSSLSELESMGEKATGSLSFAKSYCETINDGTVEGETVPRVTTFISTCSTILKESTLLLNNNILHVYVETLSTECWRSPSARRYMFASQDKELRYSIGRIPGTSLSMRILL
jgi:U3 small nucleolar RNA-associated protein 23